MTTQPKIAILVLNYCGLHYLRDFITSASFIKNSEFTDLFIVDNASYDGSMEYIESCHPWVKTIQNGANLGWAGGYNRAVQKIREQEDSYDFYLFLNNDVRISPEWLDKLVTAARDAHVSIGEFGSRALFASPFIVESPLEIDGTVGFHTLTAAENHDCLTLRESAGKLMVDVRHMTRRQQPLPSRLAMHRGSEKFVKNCYAVQLHLREDAKSVRVRIPSCAYRTYVRNRQLVIDATAMPSGLPLFDDSSPPPQAIPLSGIQCLLLVRRYNPVAEGSFLVQNSGSGLTERLQGYDLHCYERADIPQAFDKVKAICGVCKLVRADVFHELGGFDEGYFMYYEDTDFSLRLQKQGYRSQVVDEALFFHVHAGTSNATSQFFQRQVARSLLHFQYRHGALAQRLATFLQFLYHALRERVCFQHDWACPHIHALTVFQRQHGSMMRFLEGYKNS